MRPAAVCALLAIVLALPSNPAARAGAWVRVETPNFIVYGDTSERRLRDVAAEFERFREALARVIPGAATPAAVPTVVVVFDSKRSFEPYAPRFNGKPVKVGGYFFATEDMNLVALADEDRDNSLRTIFHEYVHLVVANGTREMPVWLNEGLAEYYSTFETQDDGRRALIGRVIPSHLQLLSQRRLMTIPELLAVERSSSAYNEGERQSLFYAQSWALVHMLVSGMNRSGALAKYANLVSSGIASQAAWEQVFGSENFVSALDRYIGQEVMKGFLYQFDREIARIKSDAAIVTAADAEATLADLLRRVGTPAEAEARFDKAIGMEPASARARALSGLLSLDQNQNDRARALLLEAAVDKFDWLVQYHVASGLTRLTAARNSPDPALIDTARAALARVFAARPDLPNALALSARLESSGDGDLTPALESIRRARKTSPGREDYALLEAYILTRRSEYTAAKDLLAPFLTPRYPEHVRESARHLMGQVVRLQLAAADYLAKLEGRQPSAPAERPAAADVAADTEPTPVYRELKPDEQRTEGLLERINCAANGVQFLVRVGDTVARFDAPLLQGVEFISYRNDLRGAVTCGARTPPDRVYITWKPAQTGKSSGRAISVEFLPKR